MNDDLRERLSAYLDGSLSRIERASIEAQLARSQDLKRELESLRAVSGALKKLPVAEPPQELMERLDQLLGAAPGRDWILLPPAYRPVAFALSSAIVCLVIWDKTRPPEEVSAPRSGWQGDVVAVKSAADSPSPELNFSEAISSMSASASAAGPSDAAQPPSPETPSRAAQPALGSPVEAAPSSDSFSARSEEERSAINERLHETLELEKKKMGIVKVLDKSASVVEEPVAPRFPPPTALVLKDADSLRAAWTAAGLEGPPPSVDFPEQMAIFLVCQSRCGIVSLRPGKKILMVLYKDSGVDNAASRVLAVPASDKPIVLRPAPGSNMDR